jgi:hypothetical protein
MEAVETIKDRTGHYLIEFQRRWHILSCSADVAQLAEQRFCKPQVTGSIPVIGFAWHFLALSSHRF